MSRTLAPPNKDQSYFTKTASQTKVINARPVLYRGGTRL